MSDLAIFRFEREDVRSVQVDGVTVFVAKDVCTVLGISKYRDAIGQLDFDERVSVAVDTLGGSQQVTAVTEAGVYSLAMISRSPRVKPFMRWITHDVLPTIRRTGGYSRSEVNALPQSYGEALRMLADEVEARSALTAKVEADAPKVEYVEAFVDHDDVVLFRVAANELGIPEGELRNRLLAAGWVYKTLIGTRWSKSVGRDVKEYEYRAAAAHADKFRSMPQHNAPRHHNGQVRTTLYIRSAALPAIRRRVLSNLSAVTA